MRLILVAVCIALLTSIAVAQQVNDTTKIITLQLKMQNTEYGRVLTNTNITVQYGQPSIHIIDWQDLGVEVSSTNGSAIEAFGIADPSVIYYEDGGISYLGEVNFTVTFLFQNNTKSVTITDKPFNSTLLSVDLAGALRAFCSSIDYANDPECSSIMAAGAPMDMTIITIVALVLVVAVIIVILVLFAKTRKAKPAPRRGR